MIVLEGENSAGDVLGDVLLIGQGDKDKAPVITTNTLGNKATIGEVMGRVVDPPKQFQHNQADQGKDSKVQAIHVGEGLPPVPSQLVERIERGDFIEMCELIPECWMVEKGKEASAQWMICNRGRKQSQDILVWAQCCAMYVAVVSGRWPRRVPEMMAYMINIIKASQEYEGLAWFLDDEAYHKQAAATGHTEWSIVNPSIFTVCFTANVKGGKRCKWCLSLTRDSSECTRFEGESVLTVRLMAMEESVGTAMPGSGSRGPPVGYKLSEVCNFIMRAGVIIKCACEHVCRACKGDHPAIEKPDCHVRVMGWCATDPMHQGRSLRGREWGFPY